MSLAAAPDNGPIIMLNLLRFAEPNGRADYGRYSAVAFGTVKARGGSASYLGHAVSKPSAWDTAILVRYPRRAAYLDMQSDPAYLGAIPDRTAGLAARLITPFHLPDGSPDEPFAIPSPSDDEVVVVSLHDGPVAKPGVTLLALEADVPMVTDRVWSKLSVLRFASIDEAESSRPEDSLWLVTRPDRLV